MAAAAAAVPVPVAAAAVAVVADAAVCSVGDATDACRKRGRTTRLWHGRAVTERVRKVNRKNWSPCPLITLLVAP